jgi:tetratricopeptide (TPR) repeat protein/tRNA A-37 threonylcarbamoyl transferase component Bud32
MGVVYEAEQSAPVRRRVALKVIRPGMDSAAVAARFDAERQALALMDHPNIATVHDAGTTASGRPYFVMELVAGAPITDYCDGARLTPRRRLELFLPVCAAVQHAHQKGVIHRDLKPSNVLVAEVDGRPVPKVIDFGVAKAVDQRRAERTLFTRLGTIIGTPEYMSPEQAGAGPDVDTRTDVYALGVLLYELLTGTTPLDRDTLRRAALDEVLRRVREEEPPKPSTRLSGTNDRLPSVAAQRDTEPARLSRLVLGDLDWMIMRALEKDRSRRYETATAFARDVQRHLDGDPVEAGPPSRSYRLRKFARKHRASLATAAAFVLVLVAATAVSAWEAWRATRAEQVAERRLGEVQRANAATSAALDGTRKAQAATWEALKQSEEARAQAEAVSDFLSNVFRSPDPSQSGREVKVADVLNRAVGELDEITTWSPATKGALLDALGQTYFGLGLNDKAIATHETARALRETSLGPDHPDTLVTRNNLAYAYRAAGKTAAAIRLHEETLRLQEAKLGPDHPDTLVSRNNLALAYQDSGRHSEAIRMDEETLMLRESKLGPDHPHTLSTRNNLASAYSSVGRLDDAVRLQQGTLRLCESKLGPDHPDTLSARNNLAGYHQVAGRTAEVLGTLKEILRLCESKLGPDHPDTLVSRNNLAVAYLTSGATNEGILMLEETLRQRESKLGLDHPHTLTNRSNLAAAYWQAGRTEESIRMEKATLGLMESKLGPDHPSTLRSRHNLAFAYEALGLPADAEPLRRDVLDGVRRSLGPDDPPTITAMASLGLNLLMQRKWQEAELVLRECLAVRQKYQPDAWATFSARSRLGEALLGQGRYDEAEPLIVSGYEGMKARETTIPAPSKELFPEAAERVLRLYESWGKPDRAAAWKVKLGLADLPADPFAPP